MVNENILHQLKNMTDKSEKYKLLLLQAEALIEDENDLIANLANISALLKEAFDFLWVGFYLVKDDDLVLGPFQGPFACSRIKKGKGVCGTAWETKTTQLVPDVHKFPGHIACSSLSNSEIVIALLDREGEVWAVLDVDSDRTDHFDETDKVNLEYLCHTILAK